MRLIAMKQTAATPPPNQPVVTPSDPAAARRFALEAARLAGNTRCHDVSILDLTGLLPVTDFFVLATGTSARQMRTVCDELDELATQYGLKIFRRSGYEGESWIVVDFVDVVLHLFSPEARRYYDLDNLWGDAPRVAWQEQQGNNK
jgi:ribosome-associated protein